MNLTAASTATKCPRIVTGMLLTPVLLFCWIASYKTIAHANPSLPASTLFLISRITFWCCLFLIWIYALTYEKHPLLLWREKKYSLATSALSVILILLLVFAGSAALSILLHILGFSQHSDQIRILLSMNIPIKLFGVLTAAVAEELIFRGYLMSRLQLYFQRPWMPVIISSLLFGLAHAGYGTLSNMLIPTFIGIVFGWYYQKYRNIAILMICHFLIDFYSLLIAGR